MSAADWLVVAGLCLVSVAVGLRYARRAAKGGVEGYFTGNRDLPWWAIGLSNTATYQSGNGGFVMLVLVFGLAGNWLWWAAWVIWMPLVAVIWARLWRRMQIVTTAEFITLRYGGRPAQWARRIYALVCCFGFCVLLIGYITGFFAKTIAPLVPMSETQILLIFGGITVLYTMFGGLTGVVYVDVVQFLVLFTGSTVFLFLAVPQHGGWAEILARIQAVRPEALQQTPPVRGVEWLLVLILVFQGLFFAGSPAAGEGMTAQRFMGARSERHAVGGQLFNAFLALSARTLPLIGLGIISLSLFWTAGLASDLGPAPEGMTVIVDPAYAWGELVRRCTLPTGLVGLLVAAEVAAYMSTLSSLINWGSSFVVNDLASLVRRRGGEAARASAVVAGAIVTADRMPASDSGARHQIWVTRLTTLFLFAAAAGVAMLYVKDMVGWFMYINSAMVIFLLPLAWFRFFWWRFNVWGELAAIVLGLPLSILVWFVLDYQSKPMWQGLGILFGLSFLVLPAAVLLTPSESMETLKRFYRTCRPPGLWGPVRRELPEVGAGDPSFARLWGDSLMGVAACVGLVLATNAVFVGDWARFGVSLAAAAGFGGWLLARVLEVGVPRPAAEEPD
ncbi:MAG: sodium:solute symporter [Gemmatimonadota bacterium]